MNGLVYALGIAGALAFLFVVAEMLRRRKLRERHAVWWLIAALLALVLALFPGLLEGVSEALGVGVSTNLLFFASLICVFLVCLQQSAELTKSEERVRTLVESSALLELRVRRLEQEATADEDAPSAD